MTRYDLFSTVLEPSPDGAWVRYEDVLTLLRQIDRASALNDSCCPVCNSHPWDTHAGRKGHYDDCAMADLLLGSAQ